MLWPHSEEWFLKIPPPPPPLAYWFTLLVAILTLSINIIGRAAYEPDIWSFLVPHAHACNTLRATGARSILISCMCAHVVHTRKSTRLATCCVAVLFLVVVVVVVSVRRRVNKKHLRRVCKLLAIISEIVFSPNALVKFEVQCGVLYLKCSSHFFTIPTNIYDMCFVVLCIAAEKKLWPSSMAMVMDTRPMAMSSPPLLPQLQLPMQGTVLLPPVHNTHRFLPPQLHLLSSLVLGIRHIRCSNLQQLLLVKHTYLLLHQQVCLLIDVACPRMTCWEQTLQMIRSKTLAASKGVVEGKKSFVWTLRPAHVRLNRMHDMPSQRLSLLLF